ncbi:hypothetical protein [Lachnospira sp.]|jgi:hypothetical protein|uniref:hypothetical protein n=1 Tax=Lachnospira sp. TaxID=2049031 RepID=UPI00257CF36E|nr:hypothetical protein [Lachnospira sp.]
MAGDVVGNIDYYSSGSTHQLRLFSPGSNIPFSTIDVTDFIKDGMVDNVYIDNSLGGQDKLVITFNTDAGKQDIEIPISSIFNATNYYTKTESDAKYVTAVGYDTTNGRATYTVNGNA